MPKIVDHDARREEVLGALWRVVQRDGLQGATMRAIAREAGVSSGVLAHYFEDKDDILRSGLELVNRQIAEGAARILIRAKGLGALIEVLGLTLPLDDQRQRTVQFEVSTWSRALGDERQRDEHLGYYDAWCELVRTLLLAAIDLGEMPSTVDVELTTLSLVAFADGLAVDALLHPERVSTTRQRSLLDLQVRALAAVAPPPSAEEGD